MKLITITPRVIDKICKKCKREILIGEQAMVQRTKGKGKFCMECWEKICMK